MDTAAAARAVCARWGRPALGWDEIIAGIRHHGIRNAAQTTVAPTGTIGTVAGCEGYGCEPVFALAYTRTVKDGDRDLKLTYTSPLFEQALAAAGLDQDARERISEIVSLTGGCQDVLDVPALSAVCSSSHPTSPPRSTSACRRRFRHLWTT